MTISDVQLPLFFNSITFIQRIHRVFVILRHDQYLATRSRFYGQQPSRWVVYRGSLWSRRDSFDPSRPPPPPPSSVRSCITVGIALRTMRPRLSLLLETGPLKGPVPPDAADMRHLHADLPDTREKRWVIAFDLKHFPPETEARFIAVRPSTLACKAVCEGDGDTRCQHIVTSGYRAHTVDMVV